MSQPSQPARGGGRRQAAQRAEQNTPDEPATSQVAGASSSGRPTRSATRQAESSLSDAELILRDLDSALNIIDSNSKSGTWLQLRVSLRDLLKPARDRAFALSKTTPPAAVPPSPNQGRDLRSAGMPEPAPSAPARSDPSFLTVHDVEEAIARTVPALLKEVLARELKDLRPAATPTPSSTDGASSAGRCCTAHSHANDVVLALPALSKARERDVVVSLSSVPRTDAVHSRSEGEIMAAVEAAVSHSLPKGAPAVHGVSKLKNGDVRIRATTDEAKSALAANQNLWLPAVADGAQVKRDLYELEVRGVPTTFDPAAVGAPLAIFSSNSTVFPSLSSIVALKWKLDLAHTPKPASSLLLTVDGLDIVRDASYNGLSINGHVCDVSPHLPKPQQCYYCQAWGHTINNCARKNSKDTISCARCAGPHALRDCSCPVTPACSSARSCPHIVVKCANCGGAHRSLSVDCPVRQRAVAEVARLPKNARALAAHTSLLPRHGGAAASDTRRSLSFSGSPRAGSAWRD